MKVVLHQFQLTKKGRTFPLKRGVKQEDSLSPILFTGVCLLKIRLAAKWHKCK